MATLINNAGVQHYANKMVLAENRKVGSKSLPTALNDIDNLIDEMKTHFDAEYGSALDMKLENNENVFSVGTGTNVDKRSEVENSFTDVELYGNSLVNLFKNFEEKSVNRVTEGENIQLVAFVNPCQCNLIEGEVYTCLLEINNLGDPVKSVYFEYSCEQGWGAGLSYNVTFPEGKTHFKKSFTFKSGLGQMNNFFFGTTSSEIQTINLRAGNIMLLKGDWTNKPIPQYFEGLKSIGEKEDGNHKISISSSNDVWHNKGFTRNCYIQDSNGNIIMENNQPQNCVTDFIQVKPNTTYTRNGLNSVCCTHVFFDENKNRVDSINATDYSKPFTFTTPSNCKYLRFKFYLPTTGNVDTIYLIEGTGTEKTSNKKEILLNEPLRGLQNGVKDTIEKVNGEWKIVRRCGEIVLDGSEHWSKYTPNETSSCFGHVIDDIATKYQYGLVCDRFASAKDYYPDSVTDEGINQHGNKVLLIRINHSRLSSQDVAGFKQWLSQNPTKVIYELATPIVEDISPVTLQCWKNGTISIDEILPVETTHTVALNKPAQIKRNIEELTALRKRVQALEDFYDQVALEQAHQLSLINHSIELDYDI